jgi:hypothetical protein
MGVEAVSSFQADREREVAYSSRRNCAIYGLGNYIQKSGKTRQPDQDIAILGCLPKHVFAV